MTSSWQPAGSEAIQPQGHWDEVPMETLAYKPNLGDVLERLRLLYERRAQDRICASFEAPSEVLTEFQAHHPEGFCDDPDLSARIAFWDALFRERMAVRDDTVPSAYLSELDQGLYGGLLGGAVQFMCDPETGWISSMVAPLLGDWSEFHALRFDETHPWFRRYVRQLEVFREGSKGKFGVSHFILIDSLNLVFELVGATQTYIAMIERRETVQQAIDFAFELNVKVQETFFKIIPSLRGGTCSNMIQWMPGRIVSESVDPFHMTSVDYFEAWGRPPVERIYAHFDGGVLHIHGNGRHLLEAVASLKGLKAIYLGDDRAFPLAFDVLPHLQARTGEIPLVVSADYQGFVDKLNRHDLPGGVFYQVKNAPGTNEANRTMDRVRAYRA